MNLNLAAQTASVIFELPARGFERVANRHVNVLVRSMSLEVLGRFRAVALCKLAVHRRLMPNNKLGARNVEFDANVKELAVFVMSMRHFHDDAATGDARVVAVELRGFCVDASRHRWRRLHVPKGDLNGRDHSFNGLMIFFRQRAAVQRAMADELAAGAALEGEELCVPFLCHLKAFVPVLLATQRAGLSAENLRAQREAARRAAQVSAAGAPERSAYAAGRPAVVVL